MSKIAEEAELSKGTLYLYFRKKESIVYEILYGFLTDLWSRTRQAAETEGTGYEKAERMLQAFSSYYHRNDEFLTLSRYLDYQVKSSAEAGEEAKRCFDVVEEMKRTAVEVMQTGVRDGSIRSDIDPVLTSATVVHMVESFLLKFSTRRSVTDNDYRQSRTDKQQDYFEFDPKEMVDHLLHLILYSLRR